MGEEFLALEQIKCPTDGHLCSSSGCLEMAEFENQDCRVFARNLAKAGRRIATLNNFLIVAKDPDHPTLEELGNCLNITTTIQEAARRIGVNELSLILETVNFMTSQEQEKEKKREKRKKASHKGKRKK